MIIDSTNRVKKIQFRLLRKLTWKGLNILPIQGAIDVEEELVVIEWEM